MYITQIWPMQSCFPTIFSILTLLLISCSWSDLHFLRKSFTIGFPCKLCLFFSHACWLLVKMASNYWEFFFVSGLISRTCMCYSRPANLLSHKTATDQMEERMRKRYRLELVIINRIGHALVILGCSSYNITTRRNRSLAINVYASTSAPS